MEVQFKVLYDELREDGSRLSDGIIRDIQRRFGNEAVWEKYDGGWRVMA